MSAKAGLLGVSVVEEERGRPACNRASWVLRRWICGLPFWGGSPVPPALLRRLCRLVPRFIIGGPRICCRTRLRAAGGAEVAGVSESKGRAEEVGVSPTSDPTSAGSEGGALAQDEAESCGETEERRRCGWKNCFRPWPNAPMFSRALWVILDKPCSDSDALLPSSGSARPPASGSSGLCSLLPWSIWGLQFHSEGPARGVKETSYAPSTPRPLRGRLKAGKQSGWRSVGPFEWACICGLAQCHACLPQKENKIYYDMQQWVRNIISSRRIGNNTKQQKPGLAQTWPFFFLQSTSFLVNFCSQSG